jgi:hypothetical protein
MSERMIAEIWIGGRISHELAQELCAAIRGQGVMTGWSEELFEPQSADDLLVTVGPDAHGVTLLHLCDEQANWGELNELEAFLEEHQIPYARRSEGNSPFDAERVEFRPGGPPITLLASASGEAVVPRSKLEPLQTAMEQALLSAQQGNLELTLTHVRSAREALLAAMPSIPPLPPFEIEPPTPTG